MKKILPFFLFLFFYMSSFSQEELVFSYDSAGNQILRDRICVGCAQKSITAKKQIDSILAHVPKTMSNKDEVGFTAYPNPVTHILSTTRIMGS